VAGVRVGVIGLGRFGRLHARTFTELGCTLAAVCDPDTAALAEVDVEARFTSVDAMLAEAELDAVSIVSDEPTHGEVALRCLEHDLAVFVEKPLATSLDQAQAVASEAERRGRLVMVGNISRFDARYAMLRRQSFGRISLVAARRNFSTAWFAAYGSRVHPVFESMVHDLDLALWFLPAPVRRVYAQSLASGAADTDVPDVLVATLTTADGALAVLQSAWLAPAGAPSTLAPPFDLEGTIDAQLDVVGTERAGRVDAMAPGVSVWGSEGTTVPDVGLWPEIHGRMAGALRDELAHFVECVRAGTQSPIAPLADSVQAVALAEAIVRSAESGEPVEL
jgi:predicted dehydrogenase